MGLFDGWRRKKKTTAGPTKVKEKPVGEIDESIPESLNEDAGVNELLAHYINLTQRREELQKESDALTQQLDSGEISAIDFRKELMIRIIEAASVNDQLKDTEGKLISLGYKGSFH